MRIAIVTDAWHPQINGVVTTLEQTARELAALGHVTEFITPRDFPSLPCPGYAEIRLSVLPARRVDRRLQVLRPDAIHIVTEGPLGLAARRHCLRNGLAFTSSYHTCFPEYLRARAPVPLCWSYAWLRRFHAASVRTLVATQSLENRLAARGFTGLARWSRGVDTQRFRPGSGKAPGLPRPVFVYLGRIAVEKNLDAFLRCDLPGSKLVIGDGPDLPRLRAAYPGTCFAGRQTGTALVQHLAAGDVFVFPSRTDTFGLVMLEAMACGLPVAAYPVMGPRDVVVPGLTGMLDENLERAARACLQLDPAACRRHAEQYSWHSCTQQFLANLVGVNGRTRAA